MKLLKKMAIIIAIAAVGILLLLYALLVVYAYLTGDDDYIPEKRYMDQVNIVLNGNPYILSQIEEEVNSVVNKHEKEMMFKYAEYNFYQDGSETLTLYYDKDIDTENICVVIKVEIDIKKSIIYEIDYKKGGSKAVSSFYYKKMNQVKEIPVQDAYDDFLANNTYEPENENIYIQIIYKDGGIDVRVLEKERVYSRKIFEYIYKEPEYP